MGLTKLQVSVGNVPPIWNLSAEVWRSILATFAYLKRKRPLVLEAFPCLVTSVSMRPRYLLVAYLRIPSTLYDATSPGVSQRGGSFLQAPRYQFEWGYVVVRLR